MRSEFDDVEARLREFRPKRPAAIPDERLQRRRRPIWVAVAAGTAAVMLIAARLQAPATPPPPPAVETVTVTVTSSTLGALTTIALEMPEEFDAVLTQMSRTTLPDVTQPGGALQQLAEIR